MPTTPIEAAVLAAPKQKAHLHRWRSTLGGRTYVRRFASKDGIEEPKWRSLPLGMPQGGLVTYACPCGTTLTTANRGW